MTQTAKSKVFVVGNNVMGSRPDGWWRDRAGAARRLVAEIIPLALNHGGVWTIVFDGKEPPRMPPSPECLIVVHTGHGRRDGADDRIVELVHEHSDRAASVVYTSDATLRTRVNVVKHALLTPRNPARSMGYRTDRHRTRAPINTYACTPSPSPSRRLTKSATNRIQ